MHAKKALPLILLVPALAAGGCSQDSTEPPPPPPPPVDGYAFTFTPPAGAPGISSMSIRGSFNAWNSTAMTERTDGTWQAIIDLDDGSYQYKFFINGGWIDDMCFDETWGDPSHGYVVDPDADGCTSDGYEGQNAVLTLGSVGLEYHHTSTDPALVSIAAGRLSVRFRARSGQVVAAAAIVGADTTAFHHQLNTGLQEFWRVSLPETVMSYSIDVETPDSVARYGPYDVPGEPFRSVPWVEDAVGYQIFPERFSNGDPTNDSLALDSDEYEFRDPALGGSMPTVSQWDDDPLDTHCCHQYFGGDLQGIIDRLDYLETLGATVLYMNPIFLAGSAHGYDTFDYFEVAPNFGDSTVLRSLVDAAHARAIRLIWDFVPNHVGIGHWAFQDAVQNGEASDYWDWFEFYVPADSIQVGNGNHYEAWWGLGSLPELQTVNPDVMAHLMDVARGWTEFGLDGIRVDVPGDIENRSQFFTTFRQTAKAVDPEVYLVGEIWEQAPGWLQGDQFDALMNYAMGQGVVEQFARNRIAGVIAARQMADLYAAYPEASTAMQFNLVASHDTDRLLTKMGGGELGDSPSPTTLTRHRLAAAFLFALPGMPVTFQGDECAFLGGSGGNHTARYPIQWDACDMAMNAHYAELATLKRTLAGLGSPVIRQYTASPRVVAFYRGEPGPGEVLAVFNNGGSTSLELPAGSWSDAVTGSTETGSASVGALGWRYLVRDEGGSP